MKVCFKCGRRECPMCGGSARVLRKPSEGTDADGAVLITERGFTRACHCPGCRGGWLDPETGTFMLLAIQQRFEFTAPERPEGVWAKISQTMAGRIDPGSEWHRYEPALSDMVTLLGALHEPLCPHCQEEGA